VIFQGFTVAFGLVNQGNSSWRVRRVYE